MVFFMIRKGFGGVLSEYFFESGPHDSRFGVNSGPVTDSNDPLVDQHTQSIDDFTAFGPSVPHEMGGGGIGDNIGHHHFRMQAFWIKVEPGIEVGEQANGGRVDHHIGFGWNGKSGIPEGEVCKAGKFVLKQGG